ncbi:MAG: hypothetical protein PHP04_14375 [Bacteroidales bacterium]|nr:hypothetical protein [Bacteroidales bacterium]
MKTFLCPVCSCTTWSIDKMAAVINGLPKNYKILNCVSCGLRRLEPQLNSEELTDLYAGAYFMKEVDLSSKFIGIEGVSSNMSEVAEVRHPKFILTFTVVR